MLGGIIILVIGLAFLLQNLGLITGNFWNILWPLILIAIGLSLLFRRRYWWGDWRHRGWPRHDDHWPHGFNKKEEQNDQN
jgi:hypothetical protein